MQTEPKEGDRLSDEEIARRRDAAVRRALNTPPQPMAGDGEKGRKPARKKRRPRKSG
jgi:hypothetical protein